MKQSVALLLVLAMLIVLLPTLEIKTSAENTDELPVLNKTIVGTVSFQSFNFLGDNDTGEDGTDYSTTFYYTDDYFSPSAVNPKVSEITDATQAWTELEDVSMAACSMDFAVASYTSAVGDVMGVSARTWDNTDYTGEYGFHPENGKSENVIQFLSSCGFDNIEPVNLNKRPTNDSIGYTLGSKEITVWDETTHSNETYTLVAVGVRGAGYGAEWASNVTIGNTSTNALPSNGRHYGFDHSADIVCSGIRDYLEELGGKGKLNDRVKYWVTGFSRAGAVANLVAGKLTDRASTDYYSSQDDIYGYTWECPQGAATHDDALSYKNIHNIINAMDAVPKVSPSDFDHCRLGVDYQMPYHGNTDSSTNEIYYKRMFEVLKTIAVGNGTAPDPLVDDGNTNAAYDGYVSPSQYPYNSKMTMYKMSGWQLIQDAIAGTDTLMSNFGTVLAQGNVNVPVLGASDGGWYIDQFIDELIDVFLTSNAWVGDIGNNRTAIQNRTTFIQNYQADFRTLLGYFLDFSGPAFLGMLPKLISAIQPQFTDITNIGLGLAFYNFYNDPTGTYKNSVKYTPMYLVYRAAGWWGKKTKDVLISKAREAAIEVADDMTSGFTDPQGITRAQMHSAMGNIVELVVNLYAYELDAYESQYLGTTLRYMWTILCTHEQETVLSWIMSLDPNHINRGYRTLTVPKATDVKLMLFRDEYADLEGTLSASGQGVLAAECKNGKYVPLKDPGGTEQNTLDERISVMDDGTNMIIRYPSMLDIRLDITTADEDTSFDDITFQLDDYMTKTETKDVSTGEKQYGDEYDSSSYKKITNVSSQTNAETYNGYNRYTIPLSSHDTLQIMANGTTTYDNSGSGDSEVYSINKLIYANTIVEGQIQSDEGDVETYVPYVMDRDATQYTCETMQNQISYTGTKGEGVSTSSVTGLGEEEPDAHIGNVIQITIPAVKDNNVVRSYFVTDSSKENNQRLVTTSEEYEAKNVTTRTTDSFTVDTGTDIPGILQAEDQVYHVFYAGDFPSTFTLVHQDGTSETITVKNATKGYDVTQNLAEDTLYGGLFLKSDYSTPAKQPGTRLIPEDGAKYYMREVSKQYLNLRTIYTRKSGNIVGSYLIANVDTDNYDQVGFRYGGRTDVSSEDVYDEVVVVTVSNGIRKENPVDAATLFGGTASGKLAVDTTNRKDYSGTVQAYWITMDQVLVTGPSVRTMADGEREADNSAKSVCTAVKDSDSKKATKLNVQTSFIPDAEGDVTPVEDKTAVLRYVTASLDGNIALNFYMQLGANAAADADAYMLFEIPGMERTKSKVKLSDAVVKKIGNEEYYVFSTGMAAKDMTGEVNAQFVQSDGTQSIEYSYTVRKYCDYIINHPENYTENAVALAKAILNYGGYAQEYFKYNTSDLANEGLNLALPEVELDDSYLPTENGRCTGLTYKGTSLLLKTTTSLKHYFALDNPDRYRFEFAGEEIPVELNKDNGLYYVRIGGIFAGDLDKPFALTVTNREDGSVYNLSYSVYTNIRKTLEKGKDIAAERMMKALYAFGEAAKAYFSETTS